MIVPAGLGFNSFVIVAITVAALYLTREILVPLALAVLLSFVLAHLVRVLQRWRFPRSAAIGSAVACALAIIAALGTMVMVQVSQLATDLPRYQTTLGEKIQHVRDVVGTSSLLENASGLLTNLGKQLEKPEVERSGPPALTPSANPAKPIPVEVHQPPPGASETLVSVLKPLITPLSTTGIVLLFVIFFLVQREDLRDRFIRLAGSEDIERTTRALDDAGQRLGKLFVTQLVLNALFGLLIGVGLAVIGVPSAPLWGLTAMILRFVPYIGALMAVVLPVTLAAAVGEGWTMVFWTIALFALVDIVMGHIIEPFIYGRSAGLSPVAVVVSAVFWTWLWGPLGLLMSTPLTLCLVVLSRHVERFQFIEIMLGDKPALTLQQTTYQRMLTGDPVEAIEQAEEFLKEGKVTAYYEDVLIPALRLAQADAERGRLDDIRLENIFKTVSDLVEDFAEHSESDATLPELPDGKIVQLPTGDFGKTVFCLPGLGRLDDCGALIVADMLKRKGVNARVTGVEAAIENDEAPSMCICYLENVSKARLEYAVRRLSRRAPAARILVCLLTEAEQDASASGQNPLPSRSLKATIAALALSNGSQAASSVQNAKDMEIGRSTSG